jgi:carbonic anhydrase
MPAHGTFATAITCMDGRVQMPVSAWIKKQFNVNFVDTITEPGPDKILAAGESQLTESIKRRVRISVEKHGSHNIVIVAHHDCAGNPVSKNEHIAHLQKSRTLVSSWNLPVKISLLWVTDLWQAEEIR